MARTAARTAACCDMPVRAGGGIAAPSMSRAAPELAIAALAGMARMACRSSPRVARRIARCRRSSRH